MASMSAHPFPQTFAGALPRTRAPRRIAMARPWLWILLACTVLGTLTWAAATPIAPEAREETHTIPQGTWARRRAGQDVEILPSTIHLTMGVKDILVLVNKDDVPQLFGPVLMMPGQSFRLPFNLASEYQFTCTAHVSGFLTVIVAPPPSWWHLALLRVRSRFDGVAQRISA
jgi:hypothetical protein